MTGAAFAAPVLVLHEKLWYNQFDKLEFYEQNTQDIMCLPRNHDISRFVSWYLSVDSGKIGMKGGVHDEPTENG